MAGRPQNEEKNKAIIFLSFLGFNPYELARILKMHRMNVKKIIERDKRKYKNDLLFACRSFLNKFKKRKR